VTRTAGALAALAVLSAVVAIVRRQIAIVAVTGASMEPTLADGDRVLVRRTGLRSVRTGQIVVVETPGASGTWTGEPVRRDLGRSWMIKRAAALPGDPLPRGMPSTIASEPAVPDGKLVVLGDNPAVSHDSRFLGYIPGDRILGVVVGSLPRAPGGCEDRVGDGQLQRTTAPLGAAGLG
jgi:signal peptidase I